MAQTIPASKSRTMMLVGLPDVRPSATPAVLEQWISQLSMTMAGGSYEIVMCGMSVTGAWGYRPDSPGLLVNSNAL